MTVFRAMVYSHARNGPCGPEAVEMFPGLQKDLRAEIFSELGVRHPKENEAMDPIEVGLIELGKRRPVAGLGPLHKVLALPPSSMVLPALVDFTCIPTD